MNKTYSSKGFTLIESLVAISILLIAVVAPISTIGGAISQIAIARDQVTAINLAQEGIEVVRQKRDSNLLARWKQGTPVGGVYSATNPGITTKWTDGFDQTPSPHCSVKACVVTAMPPTVIQCTGGGCSATESLVNTDVNGFFTEGAGGTKTQFHRTIAIGAVATDERVVTVTVTWTTSGGLSKSVTVSESLFGINN